MWTKTASNEAAQTMIGRQLKQYLDMPDSMKIGYSVFVSPPVGVGVCAAGGVSEGAGAGAGLGCCWGCCWGCWGWAGLLSGGVSVQRAVGSGGVAHGRQVSRAPYNTRGNEPVRTRTRTTLSHPPHAPVPPSQSEKLGQGSRAKDRYSA
jgi:hypothetical protein